MPFEPVANLEHADQRYRAPAATLVGVAAAGIVVDRVWNFPFDAWLLLIIIAAVLCLVTMRFGDRTRSVRLTTVLLLLGWFGISAAWHHWRWNCRAADDIANSATDEPRIVHVVGKVVQNPWIIHQTDPNRPAWQNPVRSILVVKCQSLVKDNKQTLPVSGLVRLSVDADVTSIAVGDKLDLFGELLRPPEPANPGDFDLPAYLKSQGIFAVIRSKYAAQLTVIGRERTIWDWLIVARGMVRQRAENLFTNTLGSDTAPVAQAMLLGTRAQIDDETRRDFRESGMLHVLAISGMNVGLLWTWLWMLCRWCGQSARTSIWVVLIVLPLYALLTDANPPIVRATVVAVVILIGQLIGRSGSFGNSLAIAALVVLACNPSDLFNTGAQLSFLAVFAILHATSWLTLVHQQAAERWEEAPLRDSFVRRLAVSIGWSIVDANFIGLAIWIMTSPLIASEFHLVSPIGSLLTVFLAAPVTVMFWLGYSFLLLGLMVPQAFGWLGLLFDHCLRLFLWAVHTGASFQWGHVYVPAPPFWWTVGFYLLTLVPILLIRRRSWGTSLSVRGGLVWMVLGLAWGYHRPPHPGLTCTFISVGHGLSVLLELPNGRTALYDAGGMMGGAPIARTISKTLWRSGQSRLDAVVLSHADGDHCNAIPELSRIVRPHRIFVHHSFLDWSQPVVAAAIEQSAAVGSSLKLIAEGQSLVLDPAVSLRILHPPMDFHSPKDNPNSIVLCLEYAGRKVLLTGDLELEGLERLLQTPRLDVDVLLSPHHGSLKANPFDLARWATPEFLVVSTPEASMAEELSTRYGPETQILTTARSGAIRCLISPDGTLQLVPYRKNASGRVQPPPANAVVQQNARR